MPLPEIPELGNPSHLLSWLRNETTEAWSVAFSETVFCEFVRFLHPEASNVIMRDEGFWLLPQAKGYAIPEWVREARMALYRAADRKFKRGRPPRLTRDEVLDIILKEVGHAGETQAHPDLQPRGGLAGHA